MKKVTYFELEKDEFSLFCKDGEWVITDDLKLYNLDTDFEDGFLDKESIESRTIDRVFIGYPSLTTYRLRQFCDEFHSEVDFDTEFETWRPGVYWRYQEKFGYDYEDWVHETRFRELVDALAEKGYSLPF
jgi:hypothetical protein